MIKRLSQLERDYFVRKAGGAQAREPLNNIKRRHMSVVADMVVSPKTPFSQLEKLWLAKIITDEGGSITDFNSIATLWKDAVIAIGATPGVTVRENQRAFYLNHS